MSAPGAQLFTMEPEHASDWCRMVLYMAEHEQHTLDLSDYDHEISEERMARWVKEVETWLTADDNRQIVGVRVGDEIIGMGRLDSNSPATRHVQWISWVFVWPQWRGQGYGRALVTHMVDRCR